MRPVRSSLEEFAIAGYQSAVPSVVVGAACVVAGGLVAAVTRPAGWEHGSWIAAFLVLVAGVAQISLGVGQAWFAGPLRRSSVAAEAVAWNVGAAATIVGTLAAQPVVTTAGGLALAAALVLYLAGVREARGNRWALSLYRSVAAIVLISVPIGTGLAWIRHG
jgi:hypothetical protein